MATQHTDYVAAAKKIIERVGSHIVLGTPLGIGKPIGLLNALYRLVENDKSLNLTIVTGLTLARPTFTNELERRLVEPILDRVLKDYEDVLYEKARVEHSLPSNIRIIEFFLSPGKFLHTPYVQQNYISSKYTSVVYDASHYGVNVVAQQVSHSSANSDDYSLSCNTDLFIDMVNRMRKLKKSGIAVVAEVNNNLPFMLNDAVMHTDVFTDIVDTGKYRALFAVPFDEISVQDHLIGLYTSTLIKDGSCLQVGIGTLSNAVANAIIFRDQANVEYQSVLNKLGAEKKFGEVIANCGGMTCFSKGLYASTEMFSDEYVQLYKAGILKKKVYDHAGLQHLLNQEKISEKVTPDFFSVLLENQVINSPLTVADFNFLQKFGVFTADLYFENGKVILPSGVSLQADLSSPDFKLKVLDTCLGRQLANGMIVHAGFFFGSNDLYRFLRELPYAEAKQMNMTTVSRTNTVLWSYELSQLQRQDGRFVNSAMMVTLSGSLVSDGLKNLQEVSGVGGQFDFVNMAQDLEGARSIINCRSTRGVGTKLQSNIIWDYPNLTISRYLRDIVVTEYGIADCRSKTDAEVIKVLLNITDSRFQPSLLQKAKQFAKIENNYEIPAEFQQNFPEKITPIINELQTKGFCLAYPFGNDLTPQEMTIKSVLLKLKDLGRWNLAGIIFKSFITMQNKEVIPYLQRMQLEYPKKLPDFMYKKILSYMIGKDLRKSR